MSSPTAALHSPLMALALIVRVQQAHDCGLLQRGLQPGDAFFCLFAGLIQGSLRSRILYYLAIGRSFWYKTQLFFELDPLLR